MNRSIDLITQVRNSAIHLRALTKSLNVDEATVARLTSIADQTIDAMINVAVSSCSPGKPAWRPDDGGENGGVES